MQKKITIITSFYFPEDTAIGLYTTQFAKSLMEKGNNVKIITGFPNYPQWKIHADYLSKPKYFIEEIDNIEILRYKQYIPKKISFLGRILTMVDLFYGTLRNVYKIKSADLVICVIPYSISMIPALLLKKKFKAKLWIHVQDFEFDLALDSGIVKKNNLIFKLSKRILSLFESKMLNSAEVVSSISNSMLKKVKLKSIHNFPFYFPNWVSSEKINPKTSNKHRFINSEKFTLLYSGNIGEKQNWDFLIDLCKLILKSDNIEIVIVGDGAYKNTLQKQLNSFLFVRFYNPVPYDELNDLLCSANIHFLFQKNEVIDTVMPSKILAMMASAIPSIITGNRNSEVASIIEQSNGGFYFSDNNVATVYEKIIDIKNNNVNNACNNARNYVLENFSSDKILNDFNTKISNILNN